MSEFPMYPECRHCGAEPADNHSTENCRDRLRQQLKAVNEKYEREFKRAEASFEREHQQKARVRRQKARVFALEAALREAREVVENDHSNGDVKVNLGERTWMERKEYLAMIDYILASKESE